MKRHLNDFIVLIKSKGLNNTIKVKVTIDMYSTLLYRGTTVYKATSRVKVVYYHGHFTLQ